ncbi:MAG: hypothetical protein DRJ31_01250 [Candidatus Methanomethylicota archaeon]|uniref:Uncharacterized protein n=1 Tax=Thermoproteota archaeon TaxID=2056631 RepID=A0A497EUT2_9CREN|nr:MAG: hypothetical protein DRJ31_01250 [Candidatus Verstraetearchaeota archaeon]RLE53739.1 MAG: hypothetical protein DRJ33_00130 [Candidatus Verstraetearchaeota archaeon]
MIIASDTGSALLDENFNQVVVIACACVAAEYPFTKADKQKAVYVLSKPEDRDNILVEAKLCFDMALEVHPREVHLDISLGGARITQLNDRGDWLDKLSNKGREVLSSLMPRLKPIAQKIENETGAKVLAIGKKSPVVRLAELTAGAYGLAYAVERVFEGKLEAYVGLPKWCTAEIRDDLLILKSIKSGERCYGYAPISSMFLKNVALSEFDNPVVEGFKVVKITPISF